MWFKGSWDRGRGYGYGFACISLGDAVLELGFRRSCQAGGAGFCDLDCSTSLERSKAILPLRILGATQLCLEPDLISLKVFMSFRIRWCLGNLELVDCFPPGSQAF